MNYRFKTQHTTRRETLLYESDLAQGWMEMCGNRDKLPSSADTRPWSFCWHQDLGSHLSPWMVNRDVGARSIAEKRQGHWDALGCWLKKKKREREAPGGILQIETVSPKPTIDNPKLEKVAIMKVEQSSSRHEPDHQSQCPDVFLFESDEGLYISPLAPRTRRALFHWLTKRQLRTATDWLIVLTKGQCGSA